MLVRPGRAAGVRRCAEEVTPGPDGDRVVLSYSDPDGFARWLVGYGADVVVLAPDEVAQGDDRPPARPGRGARGARPAGRGRRMTTVARGGGGDRLGRLLNLVPYLLARPGILVAEAADDLGVTERQLREDLELLWVCGLPGYGPGDLIDMAFDGDRVTITYDAGIDRPLRLTQDEALALVVALRMLAETPGVQSREAVERALAKIEIGGRRRRGRPAGGGAPAGRRRRAARRAAGRGPAPARAADDLLHRHPRRDHRAGRRPDAGPASSAGSPTWRRGAAGPRRYGCSGSTGSTRSPSWTSRPRRRRRRGPDDVSAGVFTPSADLPLVTLRVGRWARWITEYYPCEEVVEETPERWLVSLRASDLAWARRLVLGLGPEVTVVAPAELAEAVRVEARAALAAYE